MQVYNFAKHTCFSFYTGNYKMPVWIDVLCQTMKKKRALNNCSKNVDFRYIFLQFNSVDQEPSSRKWDDF